MAVTRREIIISGSATLLLGCTGTLVANNAPRGDGGTNDGAMPDGATPDGAMPDGATADGAMPDGATADGAMPDGAAPDGALGVMQPLTYELVEDLALAGGYSHLFNSASGTPDPAAVNGKLCNSDGSAFTPTLPQYPKDGTVDLSSGRYIDTQQPLPDNEEWSIIAAYDIVMGVSYKMYVLHYHGDGTADVWHGDDKNALSLLPANTGVAYTPPTGTYRFTEAPDLPGQAP